MKVLTVTGKAGHKNNFSVFGLQVSPVQYLLIINCNSQKDSVISDQRYMVEMLKG